jgi:peroxiredoxin
MCVCASVVGLALAAPVLYRSLLSSSSLAVGEAAPDFELATLDGSRLRLSDFRGRPVLLSFGATWCPDCVRSAPFLQRLHEGQPELMVIMVDTEEDRRTVGDFASQYGLTYPVALDTDGAVARTYRVWAIPTELLIDAEGVIQARVIEQVTEDNLAAMLATVGLTP